MTLFNPLRCSTILLVLLQIAGPVLAQTNQSQTRHPTSQQSTAVSENSKPNRTVDIALQPQGQVQLTIVNSLGQPLVGQIIAVKSQSAVVARAKTDAAGQVLIRGLRPGMHVVCTGLTNQPVRFWTAQSAPPQAIASPALVDQSDVIRGQYGYGAPMAPALLAATVTAVAIAAVVIAKSDSSDSVPPVDPASP